MITRISKGPINLTGSSGRPIPPRASENTVPATNTVGTGMDVKTEPTAVGQFMILLVPGIVISVLVLVIYLSTQKK